MNHTLKAEAWYWGRSLQQHIPILVTEPWWLPIKRRVPNDLLFISMAFQLILNIYVAQPERSWNVGYRWSRVFLPGASGCTGGFFTQLLFHNPHSFSLIEAINSIAFFWCLCATVVQTSAPLPFGWWTFLGRESQVFWLLCF